MPDFTLLLGYTPRLWFPLRECWFCSTLWDWRAHIYWSPSISHQRHGWQKVLLSNILITVIYFYIVRLSWYRIHNFTLDIEIISSASKRIMGAAGVPLVPGYHGDNQDINFLKLEAEKIGYPILIKPTHGGGGKVCSLTIFYMQPCLHCI